MASEGSSGIALNVSTIRRTTSLSRAKPSISRTVLLTEYRFFIITSALSVMQRRLSDKAGYVSAVCLNCVVNLILSFLQQISGLWNKELFQILLKIPFLRDFASSACFYLLTVKNRLLSYAYQFK